MKRFKIPDYEGAETKRQCALILLIEAQNKIKMAMSYLKDMPRAAKRCKAHDIGSDARKGKMRSYERI